MEKETDVVCGMEIDGASAAHTHEHGGARYPFCSEHCRSRFIAAPEQFIREKKEIGHDCCH